ncbi:capsular polysaccharide biosynthesis protein [Palleronia caenipelagi]|uniref:Capsular polysaccharide biosynthesis protein n=1 Tax=Palleronia caenipelagi TaxID=2489174 RepID=A0A547Q5C0_9RHOB|nr:capsular polysaccharide biosynthesis protein [Palleronia caenipelagi]TRD21586.1 capsular polysaccharide biosynthesis protein [Palleronia caenipelagi]
MPPGERLRVYSGGFLNKRIRRILTLAGWRVTTGWPAVGDHVGVWGRAGRAYRGEAVSRRTSAALVRIEDAFLRSLHPGRSGDQTLGLMIDRRGLYFDPSAPSDLEHRLATGDWSEAERRRAADVITRIRDAHLTKYAATDPGLPLPESGYVLVIDQTRGDASITYGGANADSFGRMLARARDDHPDRPIVIKTHPETTNGHRAGHFGQADLDARTSLLSGPYSPWALFDRASAIYTVTSQMGFEAILAGQRPVVFGQPFYAGWGLSEDVTQPPRRGRTLTRETLAAAALIDIPVWYDPYHDRLCEVEDVIDMLEARARAWREDRRGYVANGIRLWKRRPLQKILGAVQPITFEDAPEKAADAAKRQQRPLLVWAGKETAAHRAAPELIRMEDGFLRSKGLGAELIPPLSFALDDLGIYYDPSRPSRLERLMDVPLSRNDRRRAERLLDQLLAAGLSKYNVGSATLPELPKGHRILVPGQVEDDASIRLGTTQIRRNADLLAETRRQNPQAVILYKPHPDVEAGLRPGAIEAAEADMVLPRIDPVALLEEVQEVWTMTSTLGFEALLRDVPVTCFGAPFYAGWGLTQDLGPVPDRRTARPDLIALVHAALIAYPRYHDPVTDLPCPPEVVLSRLQSGTVPHPGAANRLLAKLQGVFASQAHLWRR